MGPHYDHQVGRFGAPDPLKEREIVLRRARRARAEATAAMLAALWTGAKVLVRRVATILRHAGAGAALKPPLAETRHGTARLTRCCN